MHRFYAEPTAEGAKLSPEEANHALRVLRLQAGDPCQAILNGKIFEAVIAATEPDVTLSLGAELPSPEASVQVTLFQGLPKGDKMEYILQKCTEAGVFQVTPVLFSRCVAKWEKKDDEKKLPRWQRIMSEAGKQSGRAVIPAVTPPVTVQELCEQMKDFDLVLTPWEEARSGSIRITWQGQKKIAIVIGPEGGIDAEEIAQMSAAGALPVTLGPRIFRTETAGLAALISLLTVTGDLE